MILSCDDPLVGRDAPLERVTMPEKELTGRIARERIRAMEVPRLPLGSVEGFRALGDPSSVVSDTLDELGISGAVAGSLFRPTIPGSVIVGPALTVRNVLSRHDPFQAARDKVNGMAEFEAHNLAQAGDVLVIEGVPGVSNMGGISAQMATREGEIGAIVSGGVRDIAHSRAVGYPVWATEVTPVTGKWRIETVEINGSVTIAGVSVTAGDLVVADDTGVCFIPRDRITEVLRIAQTKIKAEQDRCNRLELGESIPNLLRATVA